ncbi:aspartyl protease family protein [Sediminitomix flava]|uniref:Aspartyl protease n=1 Tax=Sediminitomix flava TaxID=379075 RepID=A0A315ZGN6_SEDFL|nr:aspartyl protease family protein [Sediminitomix flava]PWJ44681.1 aspartyl protease [Sediminitomix flava]
MKTKFLLFILLIPLSAFSQKIDFVKQLTFTDSTRVKAKIPFKLINNLIIIPVCINDSDSLNFILDSGASFTLLSNAALAQSLGVQKVRSYSLKGLGNNFNLTAWTSTSNKVELPYIEGYNQDIIFPEIDLKLGENMGIPIHGVIGYGVFNDFIVRINYFKKYLQLYKRSYYQQKKQDKFRKKYDAFPISIEGRRAYIESYLLSNTDSQRVKLLIDSGSSHLLSLFKESSKNISIPEKSTYTFLGTGIGGNILGHIAKSKSTLFENINMGDVYISYPDSNFINYQLIKNDRNGSIGANFLRHFDVVIDYESQELLMKQREKFRDVNSYNLTGLNLIMPYPPVRFYSVEFVGENSAAASAGFQKDDVILEINNKSTFFMAFEEVQSYLKMEGKKVNFLIERNEKKVLITMTLPVPST